MRYGRAIFFSAIFAASPFVGTESKAQGTEANPRLAAARQALAEFDYKTAKPLLQRVQAISKVGSIEWSEAVFDLALCEQFGLPVTPDSIRQALQLYQDVQQHSVDRRYVARAMMNRGRIAELSDYRGDPTDLDQAHALYQQVAKQFRGEPIAAEASLRSGLTLMMAYDSPDFSKVRRGIEEIQSFLADHPADPLAGLMWQSIGDSYFAPLNDSTNALRCYEAADQVGWVDRSNIGSVYWRCAELAIRQGQIDIAAKYYRKIIQEAPTGGKSYEARLALSRIDKPGKALTLGQNDASGSRIRTQR